MTRTERQLIKKELGRKTIAKKMSRLSRQDATKELVSVHMEEMSPNEMFALAEFATRLQARNPGVHYSAGSLRTNKDYDELVNQVIDNEDRFRRYGY